MGELVTMKIIWTDVAKAQLYETYQYYKEVAGTNVAKSIRSKIREKVKKLSSFPEMGQRESNPFIQPLNYRYLVSGNYKIIYRFVREQNTVLVTAVFDARQNPNDLKV
jgi:toxin ParE1/3/4